MSRIILIGILCISFFLVKAQGKAKIIGVINNELEIPVKDANISVSGVSIGAVSNFRGEFEVSVPAEKKKYIKNFQCWLFNKKNIFNS